VKHTAAVRLLMLRYRLTSSGLVFLLPCLSPQISRDIHKNILAGLIVA
jgi:hypothetical protein